MDHSNCVPKLGRFPLIVDPLLGMTRLTKALMDEVSDLNLMYLDTFEGLGLDQALLKTSPHPFYKVVSDKQSIPLGQISLPITFRDMSNYCTETVTPRVTNHQETSITWLSTLTI
jgi:hypothetical protein